MVEIDKGTVVDWYQGLHASHRVEVICSLLEHCLPFELRFLGSIIEHLGRKDFHILRDAENKANSLHSSNATDVTAILKLLSEGPVPTSLAVNPQMLSNPVNQTTGGHHSHSMSGGSTTESTSRPSPTQKGADKPRSQTGTAAENGLQSSIPCTSPKSSCSDGCTKENDKNRDLPNDSVESDDDSERKDLWLHDETKRRKLILYLSVMSATNHDSANLYYLLLSDVDELIESLDWLEELDEMVQDEILLLYTIGSHHPAFNFEKRTYLASVLKRFKDCMVRYSKDCPKNVLHPRNYGQYYFPQQYVYYPLMQPMQPNASTKGVRPTTAYHYAQYPGYPLYMPNPQSSSNAQQFQAPQFPGSIVGQPVPLQNFVVQRQPQVGSQTVALPTVSEVSSPNATGQPPTSRSHQQSSHQSSVGQQPHSHQSSVSTCPTRTSSLASAGTVFQSQTNSVDGDSEGSCENCAWESPETSPFESPPQSITPNKNQSHRFHHQNQSKFTVHNTSVPAAPVSQATGSNFNTHFNAQSPLKPEVALPSSSSTFCNTPFPTPLPQHHLISQSVTPNVRNFSNKTCYNGTGGSTIYAAKGPSVKYSQSSQGRSQQKPIMSVGTNSHSPPHHSSYPLAQQQQQYFLMPGMDDPIDVTCRPRKISCYNCGSNQHTGPECKEASMEEMTKMQYRLNFSGAKDGE